MVKDDNDLVKSLLKRLSVVEARPDATREMLAEYVRNFDTLETAIKNIFRTLNSNANSTVEALQNVFEVVKSYHWVIDQSTLRGLENLVKEDTGFELPNYVAKIQKDVIEKQFKKLDKSLKDNLDIVFERLAKLQEAQERQQQQIDQLTQMMTVLVFMVLVALVGTLVASIGSIIGAFTHHAVLATIGALVFAFLIGVLIWIYIKESKNGESEN